MPTTLHIHGLDCADEAAELREALQSRPGVKAVFVLLTILVHANLWSAIAADMGVSLAVVFNALRLLRANGTAGQITPP